MIKLKKTIFLYHQIKSSLVKPIIFKTNKKKVPLWGKYYGKWKMYKIKEDGQIKLMPKAKKPVVD